MLSGNSVSDFRGTHKINDKNDSENIGNYQNPPLCIAIALLPFQKHLEIFSF